MCKLIFIFLSAVPLSSSLVHAETLSSSPRSASKCSLPARSVVTEQGESFYIVNARAPTLYMVSRDLYGSPRFWSRIAEKNQLKAPYVIAIGQRLALPMPPRIDETQANEILTQSWESIGDTPMAQRLGVCLDGGAVASAAADSGDVDEHESVVAHGKTSDSSHGERHGHSVYQVAMVGSLFELKTEEPAHSINNHIYSKFNYGLEIEAGYKTAGKMSYFVGGGIEHIALEDSEGGTTKVNDSNLLATFVRVERQFADPFMMHLSFYYLQRIFVSSTTEGIEVDALYLPEFRLGSAVRLFHPGYWQVQAVVDGLYALPTKKGHHDVESSYGYHAGLRFTRHLGESHSAILITALYRELLAETTHSKDAEKSAIGVVGFEF